MMLFDKARQLLMSQQDYHHLLHGQTELKTGVGRTASGISMLMNAASGSIKTVIKNVDDYLLRLLNWRRGSLDLICSLTLTLK